MQKYGHIHLRNLGVASDRFRSTDTARPSRPEPVRNRKAHGRKLNADLRNLRAIFAKSVNNQERVGVPEQHRGAALTIRSRADQPLDLGKRQLERKGLSVLGVRKLPQQRNESGSTIEARVFYTEKGFEQLLTRGENYTKWKASDKRRPVNFWLFEAAESFRIATIEDYWNDSRASFPRAVSDAEWEVWTRSSLDDQFRRAVKEIGLESQGEHTTFQDLNVYNLIGTKRQIEVLVQDSAAVIELRGASSFVARDNEFQHQSQQSQVRDLFHRIETAPDNSPIITLLDTGVNRMHPLISGSLPPARCHAADPSWDAFDSNGHGTKMAGVALFGDLGKALNSSAPVVLPVQLESVTVSAPNSSTRLPARDALSRAVDIVEETPARRVFCLAATAVGEAENGSPTSTSATLDKLAFGDGVKTRLICTAVGNVNTSQMQPYRVVHYDRRNEDYPVQSPAQAINSLSVGAATQMCSVANLLAPSGDLSPTSRTTQAWDMERPHKPDIVMEGGNHVVHPSGGHSIPHPPDMVVTTGRDFANWPVTVTGETSAATAAAARLAARVMQRYPEMRPETVRGLIVNSARWTNAMQNRHKDLVNIGYSRQQATNQILSCYGWGIPDENRLFESASNALTLLAEDTLKPYELVDGRYRLREMKYFSFPWPERALEALGSTEVEVRCTLSYFAEPDPGSNSRDEARQYPSHRLKFDFKRFGETDEQAQGRFNGALEAEKGFGDESGWLLGQYKSRGTIHQDVWQGPAYQLRNRNGISVAPNHGWWSAHGTKPEDKDVPFSLIVTMTSPEVSVDLFTEALANVPAGLLVSRAKVTV